MTEAEYAISVMRKANWFGVRDYIDLTSDDRLAVAVVFEQIELAPGFTCWDRFLEMFWPAADQSSFVEFLYRFPFRREVQRAIH